MNSSQGQMATLSDHKEADQSVLTGSKTKSTSLDQSSSRQKRHFWPGVESTTSKTSDQTLNQTMKGSDKVGEQVRLTVNEKEFLVNESRIHSTLLSNDQDCTDKACDASKSSNSSLSSLRSRFGHVKHGFRKMLSSSAASAQGRGKMFMKGKCSF
eukprot:764406-Hanusia_phi.AAC.2